MKVLVRVPVGREEAREAEREIVSSQILRRVARSSILGIDGGWVSRCV